ncbi:MAG TPA: sigma factor [Candidatus Limnocylindrales bacterium]|jgi:RNA polymerase sigma-70 factor (ECF subfamily)|nr:sigma factor [Candidatus Limnocylindrales bacterium]
MDADLVIRAQHGDKEAYAVLAAGIADRFLAVSPRILRDIDLAEDATQQALLAIWQDLPQLRDPARFESWSYRLLVHACYTEGRKQRRWAPNLRLRPHSGPLATDDLSSVVVRDELERGFRGLSIDHRAEVVLHQYKGTVYLTTGPRWSAAIIRRMTTSRSPGTTGETPNDPTQPAPAGSLRVMPATQGPVTRLAKFAGVSILLLGLALAAYGASYVSMQGLAAIVGWPVLVIGVIEFLSGIGVLLGAGWGRKIGLTYCVISAPTSFALTLGAALDGNALQYTLVFGPAFVLSAYSLIVLMVRWRAPATA